MLYIAIDGDNIGATVERYVILEERDALTQYAASVDSAIKRLGDELSAIGGLIVFCGGDSVLAEFSEDQEIALIKKLIFRTRNIGISIGSGSTMREAYLALKMAKTSGKGCWVEFETLEQHETFMENSTE